MRIVLSVLLALASPSIAQASSFATRDAFAVGACIARASTMAVASSGAIGSGAPTRSPSDAESVPAGSGDVESAAPSAMRTETSVNVRELLQNSRALLSWVRTHDATVAATRARVLQAEAEVGTSRLYPNPVIDASLSDVVVGPSNPAGLHFGDTAIYSAGVSQTIELGKRGPRSRAAELRRTSSQLASSVVLASRVAEARVALGRVVYANAKQAILAEQLASAKEVAMLEHVRMQQGALSGNDYDRLLLDTMSLELEVQRYQAAAKGAAAMCRAALYAVCNAEGAGLADLDLAVQRAPGSVETVEALKRRSDIRALALERDASRQDALLASRRAIPDPQVRLGYVHDSLLVSGDQGNTLSLGVALPLPMFDRGQHDQAKALAHALEIERTSEAVLQQAAAELEELLVRRRLVEQSLDSLERSSVPKSESIVSTTRRAFDQGQVSLTDLLVTRRTHIGLLLTVLDLKFDRFTVHSDIRKTLGLDASIAAGEP